jgi:hypothetical protein
METMEDLKRAFGSVFLRDIRSVEPDKKGFLVGEDLRIHEEKGAWVMRFLKGTPESTRGTYRKKLDEAGIAFKVGKDYTL